MERYLRKLLKDGAFKNVSPSRSLTMSKIRGKGNRTTEVRLRYALVKAGISGWSMHPVLPGRPDFFFFRRRVAIFVDGCFWHGCPRCGHIPRTRRAFWRAKIERNQERAAKWDRILKREGIRVLHVWECRLKNDLVSVVTKISVVVKERGRKFAAEPRNSRCS
jgi:DNA mismatch endonuclease (patch repair protein)